MRAKYMHVPPSTLYLTKWSGPEIPKSRPASSGFLMLLRIFCVFSKRSIATSLGLNLESLFMGSGPPNPETAASAFFFLPS